MENTARQAMEARFGKLSEDDCYPTSTLIEAFKDHALTEEELQFMVENSDDDFMVSEGALIMSHPNSPYEIMQSLVLDALNSHAEDGWDEALSLVKNRDSTQPDFADITFLLVVIAEEHLADSANPNPTRGADRLLASGVLNDEDVEGLKFQLAAHYDPSIV
ncbi:hypothetical protein [Kocuria sp.]|uniref:hypothetical protein n=1 Tax=Kocuria sp. TaxID=1871328 RepID=UPI0028AC8252|nr:hypothetical protein [Kocuria sp.]